MKNILFICISLLFNGMLNAQELSAETLKTNLTGYWQGNQMTYLPLRTDRAKVIQDCMRYKDKNYANWYLMKHYIFQDGGIPYDITATPMIQKLTFNTTLNLAIVEFVYPYNWVTHLYGKKDGKWQFHSSIQHQTQ